MKPENVRFFKSVGEFRKWLEANHDKQTQLWIGFWKKGSGKTGITYDEALENAETNLAPDINEATPILYLINHRHRLYRVLAPLISPN